MSLSHTTLRAEAMRELIVQGVTGDALRAAILLVEHSYAIGLDAAQFQEQRELAAILCWTEDQCSRAIRELRDRKIVHVHRHAGAWWYELRPCGRWQSPDVKLRKTRVPAERIVAARTAWTLAGEKSRRDPDQQDLIAWAPDEMKDGGFQARLLAASRAEAVARVDGPSTQRENGVLVDGPSSDRVDGASTGATATAAGARTRAGHVHVPTSVPQSMRHDHEHAPSASDESNGALRALSREELWSRLDEEAQYVVGLLPELFGEDGARKFERTWLLRFCDRWRNDAFRAIGETKRMKIEGARFTKGPGQCANDLFHRFKHSRKTEAAT